jgi:uncharacterized protein YbjQ (UPF0145 family)
VEIITSLLGRRQVAQSFGRVSHQETAAKKEVAEQVARQQLSHKATRKGADAIMGYSQRTTVRFKGTPFQDYAVVVTGIAIKKNR